MKERGTGQQPQQPPAPGGTSETHAARLMSARCMQAAGGAAQQRGRGASGAALLWLLDHTRTPMGAVFCATGRPTPSAMHLLYMPGWTPWRSC